MHRSGKKSTTPTTTPTTTPPTTPTSTPKKSMKRTLSYTPGTGTAATVTGTMAQTPSTPTRTDTETMVTDVPPTITARKWAKMSNTKKIDHFLSQEYKNYIIEQYKVHEFILHSFQFFHSFTNSFLFLFLFLFYIIILFVIRTNMAARHQRTAMLFLKRQRWHSSLFSR
jgi:hypothetical protein